MDVSVILLNYNNFQLTCNCIESIIGQTKDIQYEIILVDNASTECDSDRFKNIFPKIKVIKSSKNLGFAKGNNLGMQYATGRAVLLLNNDVLLINDAISIAFKKLYCDEKLGAIGAQLQYPNGIIQHNAGRFPSIGLTLLQLLRVDRLLPFSKRAKLFLGFHFDHTTETVVDWLWGTFLMMKKEVINQLPERKLPDNLFMYGEDLEWGYAIKKTGYKLYFYPEAKVTHLLGQSNYGKVKKAITENKRVIIREYKGALFEFIYRAINFVNEISLGAENRIKRSLKRN